MLKFVKQQKTFLHLFGFSKYEVKIERNNILKFALVGCTLKNRAATFSGDTLPVLPLVVPGAAEESS